MDITYLGYCTSLISSGGGRIYRPAPRCQAGQPRNRQNAAGDGAGGCERTGKGKAKMSGFKMMSY